MCVQVKTMTDTPQMMGVIIFATPWRPRRVGTPPMQSLLFLKYEIWGEETAKSDRDPWNLCIPMNFCMCPNIHTVVTMSERSTIMYLFHAWNAEANEVCSSAVQNILTDIHWIPSLLYQLKATH